PTAGSPSRCTASRARAPVRARPPAGEAHPPPRPDSGRAPGRSPRAPAPAPARRTAGTPAREHLDRPPGGDPCSAASPLHRLALELVHRFLERGGHGPPLRRRDQERRHPPGEGRWSSVPFDVDPGAPPSGGVTVMPGAFVPSLMSAVVSPHGVDLVLT